MADNINNTEIESTIKTTDVEEKALTEQEFLSDTWNVLTSDSLVSGVATRFNSAIHSLVGETLEDGIAASNGAYERLVSYGIDPNFLSDFPASFETQSQADFMENAYLSRYETVTEVRTKYGIIGNIGLDLVSETPLMALGAPLKVGQGFNNVRRAMIGSKNSTKAKLATDATLGASASLGYEFALDNLQVGYDGDYLSAAGFGAGGGLILSSIGSSFGLLGKNAFKRNDKIGYDNENDGIANEIMDEAEVKSGIIESSLQDEILVNTTVLDKKTLLDYSEAKIDYNIETTKKLDNEIIKSNEELKTANDELTNIKTALGDIPKDLDSRNLVKQKEKLTEQQIKNDEKIIDDRSASQVGNNSVKKREIVTEDVVDDFTINVISRLKDMEVEKAQSKQSELVKARQAKEKEFAKELKLKSIENKIKKDEGRKAYTKSEIKKGFDSVINKKIDGDSSIDLSTLSRRKIAELKDKVKKSLSYTKDVKPEVRNLLAAKLSDNKSALSQAKSDIESRLKRYETEEFNPENNKITSNIDEINNFYSSNNEKLFNETRSELLGKVVNEDFKKEFGYAKAKQTQISNNKKLEDKKVKIDETLEKGKLLNNILDEQKIANKKISDIKNKKSKIIKQQQQLKQKSIELKKAQDNLDTFDYTGDTLKKKMPKMYEELLKDIEGKTDPDLAELGVNYVMDRSLFANGFKDIEVTTDTKMGSMPKQNFKDIEPGTDNYNEVVGIDVENLNDEQALFLKENGSEAYKIKYVEFEKHGQSDDIKKFTEEVNNSDNHSFYDFTKGASKFFKPFAEKMSTDKNPIVANAGDFFLNSITKRHGKLDNSDIGLVVESEKRVNETSYVQSFETYIPIAKELGIKIDVDDLKQDIGLFFRDDSNNIKSSNQPYHKLIKEVSGNIKNAMDEINVRAKNSKHEKFQNYSEQWEATRSFDSDKVNDLRARVSMEEIDRGIASSISAIQPEILNKLTKDGKLYVDVLASGYRAVLFNSKSGFNNFDRFISSNQTVENMINFLEIQLNNKEGIDLFDNASDLQDILDFYKKRQAKAKRADKSKLLLDEGHTTIIKDKNGNNIEFKISDLTENNIDILARMSIEEMTGRTQLAERGITLREDFFEDIKSQALKLEEDTHVDSGRTKAQNEKRVNEIGSMIDVLRANMYGENDIKDVTQGIRTQQKAAQVFGNLATAAQLDFAFLSYIPEAARAIAISPVRGSLGLLKNTFDDIKGIKNGHRYYDKKQGKYLLVNPQNALYEKHFGFTRSVKGQALNKNQIDIGGVIETDSSGMNKAVYWTKQLANKMTAMNSWMESSNRKIAQQGTIYDLVKMSKDPDYTSTLFTKEGLESMKFSGKKFDKTLKIINKNIITLGDNAVIDLDTIQMKHPSEYGDILELINANVDQVVQRTNVGDKLFFQSSQNPYMRIYGGIAAKFRTFMLQAFGKDFARLVSYDDKGRLMKQAFAMIIGQAIAYPIKVEKAALQREDYDEYKEKMYSERMILMGATSGISWLGLPLTMVETPLQVLTGRSMYVDSLRSTSLDASFVKGNPLWQTAEAITSLTSMALKATGVKKGDITREEARNVTSQIPFSDFAKTSPFYKDLFSELSRFENQTEQTEERRVKKQSKSFDNL